MAVDGYYVVAGIARHEYKQRKMSLISALYILMKSCRFLMVKFQRPQEQVEQEQDVDGINE